MSILKNYFNKKEGEKSEIDVAPNTYFNIFNNSLIGIALCSTDGQFIKINNRFCDLLGYSEEELLKLTFEDITHPDDIERNVNEDIELINSDKENFQIEKRYIKKTGEIVSVILNVFLNTDPKSGEKYFVGQIQDISNLKETITNLQEEKLKTIHSARLSDLGEMAGGMAHEINNPLQIILSSLSGLKKKLIKEEHLDEKSDSLIERSNKSVIRISKIINSMMTFARTGDQKEFSSHGFKEVLEEALTFCEKRFAFSNVSLVKEVEDDVKINCRPIELSQVLLNLFNNAFDSVKLEKDPKNGWIKIETKIEENILHILISDGGPGIPKENLNKIFRPFFTTKKAGEGTGLGLSISKGIIEAHGGTIVYKYSDDDEGFFKIELPIN